MKTRLSAGGPFSLLRPRTAMRVVAAIGTTVVFASTANAGGPGDKLSPDLKAPAPTGTKGTWVNTVGGVTYAKIVIVADSADPDLVDLRRAVLATGGSVMNKYLSINGLLAMVPLNQVSRSRSAPMSRASRPTV